MARHIALCLFFLPLRRPKFFLVLIFCLTGFFAHHARHVTFDNSLDILLPHNSPDQQYYADIRQQFGSEEIGIVGLVAETIYSRAVLQKIARLSQALQQVKGVKHVVSLTTAPDVVQSIAQGDTLLVPHILTTAAEWTALKRRVDTTAIYRNVLVSSDGRATAISIFFFENLTDEEFAALSIDAAIQMIVDRENGPEQLFYTGLPHLKTYANTAMRHDLYRLLPLAGLAISVLLFACFRSWRGLILPVITVSLGLIWTLGIMALTNGRLHIATLALPPLALVIGTTYALHVIAAYYEQVASTDHTAIISVRVALRKVGPAIFVTAVTTAVGFSALTVHRIVGIQQFGGYAALSVLIACLLSLSLIPAVLELLPAPSPRYPSLSLEKRLYQLMFFTLQRRTGILVAGMLIVSWSAWHALSIQVDSNFQAFFGETEPVRQALTTINQHLAGSTVLYVVIEGHGPDSIKTPQALSQLNTLQGRINTLPGVKKTLSFIDHAALFDQGLRKAQQPPGSVALPTPQPFWEDGARLQGVMRLVFLSSDTVSGVVNHPHYSRTVIRVFSSFIRASQVLGLEKQILSLAEETVSPALRVQTTGTVLLHARTTRDIVIGQLSSLGLAAGCISVILAVLFRSIRLGLIAMIPNLFPLIVLFGLMGASGTILSPSTSLIAALAFGLAVDDTVHLTTRFHSALRTAPKPEDALLHMITRVGKPVCYTSLLLIVGFFILGLSRFVPIQHLGILGALTIAAAWFADLVLLPALLVMCRPKSPAAGVNS